MAPVLNGAEKLLGFLGFEIVIRRLPRPKPGHISVYSRIVIADGIDLLIDPERATLSPLKIFAN